MPVTWLDRGGAATQSEPEQQSCGAAGSLTADRSSPERLLFLFKFGCGRSGRLPRPLVSNSRNGRAGAVSAAPGDAARAAAGGAAAESQRHAGAHGAAAHQRKCGAGPALPGPGRGACGGRGAGRRGADGRGSASALPATEETTRSSLCPGGTGRCREMRFRLFCGENGVRASAPACGCHRHPLPPQRAGPGPRPRPGSFRCSRRWRFQRHRFPLEKAF